MNQKNNKKLRQQLRRDVKSNIYARYRRPICWLPGLPDSWFEIMHFPRLQFLFTFKMIHAITVGPESELICPECGGHGEICRTGPEGRQYIICKKCQGPEAETQHNFLENVTLYGGIQTKRCIKCGLSEAYYKIRGASIKCSDNADEECK